MSKSEVIASYNVGLSVNYKIKKQKVQLWSFTASSESAKDLFKWKTEKSRNLAMHRSSNEDITHKNLGQYRHHLTIHNIWQPGNCPALYMPDKRNFTVSHIQDKIYK